jgi:ankyrin repeat protein
MSFEFNNSEQNILNVDNNNNINKVSSNSINQNLNNNNNIDNSEQLFSQKINNIIFQLQESFKNHEGENRANSFQKLLNNQDLILILTELSKKNLEEIVVYILNEFTISTSSENETKEKLFTDLFLLSIKKGQIHILEQLDKLDINFSQIVDNEGNSGLILAVIYSKIQIAKFFLKRCPEMLDMKNNLGYTPLLLSVYNNDNLMFFLLANNLDNVITDGNSLCELAIRNENLDILNYLNPEINKKKCNYIPSQLLLHFASCQTSLEIFNTVVKMVKKYDYQIQSSLETPLHWAVMKANYHIVKALVTLYKENQIDIDQKNAFGVTPFFLSNLRQDKYICELLFENGADVNEQDNEGNSIVHLISALGDVKWLKYMIKKFNVNCYLKNEKGDTPFIQAILSENYKCVEFFIELFKSSKGTNSMNLNWRNKYGQTPLHAAVFTDNISIIELLLKNKADISICDLNELTPYHYAYIEEKEEIIQTIHKILGVNFIK